jgi:hypothetical protein
VTRALTDAIACPSRSVRRRPTAFPEADRRRRLLLAEAGGEAADQLAAAEDVEGQDRKGGQDDGGEDGDEKARTVPLCPRPKCGQ